MRKKVDLVNDRAAPPLARGGPAAEGAPGDFGARSDDVLERVHALMHRVRARQTDAMRAQGSPLTPLEGRVLGFFVRHPGATLRELVLHSGRDKGQLARLLGPLREAGWLRAEADPSDGRIARLFPTEQALSQHRLVQQLRAELGRQAVQGLSDAERQTLLALLARVHDNLD